MGNFFKYWTIATIVWQMVDNFVKSGGPSVNAETVVQETSKELQRRAYSGYLPSAILESSEDIIREAVDNHPSVQNWPDKKKNGDVSQG
jgi:hypothetical protein